MYCLMIRYFVRLVLCVFKYSEIICKQRICRDNVQNAPLNLIITLIKKVSTEYAETQVLKPSA